MDITIPEQPGTSADCKRISIMLGHLGDKWTIMVITMLIAKPRRFNELRRMIGGVSQQMLTRTLRSLTTDGIVYRKVFPTVPPQVEYGLTALGFSLSTPLLQLSDWVRNNIAEIEANRARAERSTSSPPVMVPVTM